jgi:hypothetical protein
MKSNVAAVHNELNHSHHNSASVEHRDFILMSRPMFLTTRIPSSIFTNRTGKRWVAGKGRGQCRGGEEGTGKEEQGGNWEALASPC